MAIEDIELKSSDEYGGLGVFSKRSFSLGEVIWNSSSAKEGRNWSLEEILNLPEIHRSQYIYWAYQVGAAEFRNAIEFDVLPFEQWEGLVPKNPFFFMNHSCDPNCWFEAGVDGDILTARSVVAAGEKLTYDYAMTETIFDQPWECQCGSPLCRKEILANDWQLPRYREAYGLHVAAHVVDLIMGRAKSGGHLK